MKYKFSKYDLSKWAILILGLVYVASFYNRYIQIDENFFAEQGYWLLNEGEVKLKSIPGILSWDTQFFVYHKLLVWISASLIYLVGWSIYTFKVFNLLIFLIFLVTYYHFIQKRLSNKEAILSLILFLTIPYIFIKSFEFRPEIIMMTLTFVSYLFIEKYLKSNELILVILSAIFAGLAFLTHLNAVTACVAGALTLLSLKKNKGFVVFSVTGILVCSIYFIPIVNGDLWSSWFYELKNWPTHNFNENVEGGFWDLIVNVLNKIVSEQKRFFWDETVIPISVIFFFSLIVSFKKIRQYNNGVLIYTFILILSLAIVGSHVAPRYLLLYLPFMVLISIECYSQSSRWIKNVIMGLIFIQSCILINTTYKVFKNNRPYSSTHRELLNYTVKNHSEIIGPWELIFNEIGNHQIYNFKTYEYQEFYNGKKFTQLEVLEDLNRRGIEFVILDEQMKNDKVFHWFRNWEIIENPYYIIEKELNGYLILKKVK